MNSSERRRNMANKQIAILGILIAYMVLNAVIGV